MYKYLFGPVPSRRLGVSLGVDLVTHKICTLDCAYCECGTTTDLTIERKEYVPYKDVIDELEHYLSTHPAPDYITFSGSGEPTLNSRIGDVIEYIKRSKALVAVLTNGTLLGQKAVSDALLKADLVIPSLDAASLSAFEKINRPHKDISLNGYIQGLVNFRSVYKGKMALEILILPGFNDSKADLQLLKQACYKINPDVIQLNTLDRPGTIPGLTPATRSSLEEIQRFLQADPDSQVFSNKKSNINNEPDHNPQSEFKNMRSLSQANYISDKKLTPTIPVEITASAPKTAKIKSYREENENSIIETIMETVHRRPCTPEDLASILGLHISQINNYLSTLKQNGQVISVAQERGIFYHSLKK
ncbi:MAG: radical SAM protein [Desulfamplus sp.]|nr:radical SAM protein [Desulfamplus sp.]